jgi:hypothetical protein
VIRARAAARAAPRAADDPPRPHATLLFNAVFCVLAIGGGAASVPMAEAMVAGRLGILIGAFAGALIVTRLLLAGLRRLPRRRAPAMWLGRVVGSCAVIVLSSVADVESADWVPSPGRRAARRISNGGPPRHCERASWTAAGCGWRRKR